MKKEGNSKLVFLVILNETTHAKAASINISCNVPDKSDNRGNKELQVKHISKKRSFWRNS